MSVSNISGGTGRYLLFCVAESGKNVNNDLWQIPLPGAKKDYDYWDSLLSNWYYFRRRESCLLLNEKATVENFIISMYYLAMKSQAGDVANIHISTHGEVNDGQQRLSAFEDQTYINENIFRFLLSFFRKDVRINLIIDVCSAFQFGVEDCHSLSPTDQQLILDAFSGMHQNIIQNLQQSFNVTFFGISASIMELSSVGKLNKAPDGYLSEVSKTKVLKGSGFWKYNAQEYRDALAMGINHHTLEMVDYIYTIFAEAYDESKEVTITFDFYAAPSEHGLKHRFMKLAETKMNIIKMLVQWSWEYLDRNDALGVLDYRRKAHVDMLLHNVPYLTFYGVKNNSFEQQYVFDI